MIFFTYLIYLTRKILRNAMQEGNFNKYPSSLETVKAQEFQRIKDAIYLDHGGSTLYSSIQVQNACKNLQDTLYGNPHSANPSSDLTTDIIHQVRCTILAHFNVSINDYDVVFCSGATEALKIVGNCFVWKRGSVYVYLNDNHTSVVGIRELAEEKLATSFCLSPPKISTTQGQMTSDLLSNYKIHHVKSNLPNGTNNMHENGTACLFAYPLQSNFSGYRYPMSWIEDVKKNGIMQLKGKKQSFHKWLVLVDAAAFVSTCPLDLKQHNADFVCISFYKMFGFPTGIGALLVKKCAEPYLNGKKYFGGGTASGYLATDNYYKERPILHERLEDGTVSFLDIINLKYGFDTLNRICGSVANICDHTFSLTQRLYHSLRNLSHSNGKPMVELYMHDRECDSPITQGPAIAFNVKRNDESYVGFNHVVHLAASRNIHLRSGCFCNVGACSWHLNLESEHLKQIYESGHSCGDSLDLLNGRPVGALRVSLGYMSTVHDVDAFIGFLQNCFFQNEDKSSSVASTCMLNTENDVYYDAMSNLQPAPSGNHDTVDIKLDKIILYPVKSCRGVEVSNWEISETGLKYDRNWMIVNEHGLCLTLKRCTKLALIEPHIDLAKSSLTLSADGFGSVTVKLLESDSGDEKGMQGNLCRSKVCGDSVGGLFCGNQSAIWLSKVLGESVSLLRLYPGDKRHRKTHGTNRSNEASCIGNEQLSLTNVAQYLLLSRSSLAHLHSSMLQRCECPDSFDVDAMTQRFRGNFIVSGATAFEEESWCSIHVATRDGFAVFDCAGLCSRCSMVCIDHITGERSVEPLRTLGTLPPSRFLSNENQKLSSKRRNNFGVYLSTVLTNTTIEAGADVVVEFNHGP